VTIYQVPPLFPGAGAARVQHVLRERLDAEISQPPRLVHDAGSDMELMQGRYPFEIARATVSIAENAQRRSAGFTQLFRQPRAQLVLDTICPGVVKELKFAAKVRAGLVPHVRVELARKLKDRKLNHCPFVDLPSEGSSRWGGGVSLEDMKEMIWTKPQLVVQIQFVEWTAEGRLRHSKYLGLRTDKNAKGVRRED
jgi:hypothetical protein